jgi:hypothetical protein
MSFIRQLIEKKISTAMGAAVTFGDFKFSPMSGTVELENVRIAAERFVPPFLSIGRIEASIAVARALRGEMILKSLTIDRPVLTLNIHADGKSNLPAKPRAKAEAIVPKEGTAGGFWEFNLEKISINSGRFDFRDVTRDSYRLSVEGINATITPEGRDLAITLTADSVGRRDRELEIGTVKALGKLIGGGFRDPLASALTSRASIADTLVLEITSTLLANKCFDVEIAGAIKLVTLMAILPMSPIQSWVIDGDGEVDLRAKLTIELLKSIHIRNFEMRSGGFSVDRTFGAHLKPEVVVRTPEQVATAR